MMPGQSNGSSERQLPGSIPRRLTGSWTPTSWLSAALSAFTATNREVSANSARSKSEQMWL